MTDEAKWCVESCREWYQAFCNMGKGNELSVKELLTTADLIESLAAELEQVKRERDALVEDIERAESAAEDMRHLLDTDVHPNCDYGLYMSLHDALSDIVAWNHDVSRGTKEG